jgi:branched-chain amino acid transport system substrate-binding protein
MLNGAKLYLEQHEYKLGGQKAELFVEDDQGEPGNAVAKTKKLIASDKVDVLVGPLYAPIAYVLAPIAERDQVPLLMPLSSSDDLTQRQNFQWVVRTGWTSSQGAHPFGAWVYDHLKYRKIACLSNNTSFGWEWVGGFQHSFEESGGQIVQKIWCPLKTNDLRPWISRLTKNADAVFVCTPNAASVTFDKQYRECGPGLPILAAGTNYDESLLPEMGDEAVGAISVHIYSATLSRIYNTRFVQAYRDRYQKGPSYYAESGYTTMLWLDRAITAAGHHIENKEQLLKALRQVKLLDAPRGPISVDSHGSPVQNIYVRRVDKVSDKLQNTVIETFPKVSQFWHWPATDYLSKPIYKLDYPPCTHCIETNADQSLPASNK